MEIETDRVEVTTSVSNLSENLESMNTISVHLYQVVEELIDGEESGTVTEVGSSHVRLYPFGFTQRHLSRLLRAQQVPHAYQLGQTLSFAIDDTLDNDPSLREPVFVSVNVIFIKERRFVLPLVPSPSRGASEEVFWRLMEEQRLPNLEGEETQTCSICIEDLSQNIIVMPPCLHMFHQDCLFEWLARKNSCPLCRSVPYEEDQEETET